jgi:hypothetical protein
MVAMHDSPSEKILRREVQLPQRQPTGLGVMLIASAAMFFAVAGSAFVVRARMAGHWCDRAHPAQHAPVRLHLPSPTTMIAAEPSPCGQAVYRPGENGKTTVEFRLCPPAGADRDARAARADRAQDAPRAILMADH